LKLIIAGGRDFNDYNRMASDFDTVFCENIYDDYGIKEVRYRVHEIVSGMANGADTLALRLAKDEDIPVKEFPAEWDKYSVAAGPYRNKQMGDYADELLAFWDGKSKGTKHMIDYMNSLGKPVWVRMYTGKQSLQSKPMKASPKK
jgi:hypothetical protein